MRTPSTVSDVSAMSVASTTRRRPGAAGARARSCSAAGSDPCSARTSTPRSARSARAARARSISPAPGRNASTSPSSSSRARRTAAATSTAASGRHVRPRRVGATVGAHRTSTGKGRPSASTTGAPPSRGRQPRHVDRGRHGEDAEIGPQRGPGVERQRQSEVGDEVPLVDLVEHDERRPGQRRVALQAPGEDALGDHLDAGRRPDPGVVAGAVPDGPADLLAEVLGEPAGHRPRRHPAGLEHDDADRRPSTARRAAGAARWSTCPSPAGRAARPRPDRPAPTAAPAPPPPPAGSSRRSPL